MKNYLLIISFIFASGCSTFFSKPLSETDLPKARLEMQKIKKVGYFALCQGTLKRLDEKTDSQNLNQHLPPCSHSLSQYFGDKSAIEEAFTSGLKTSFPKYTWINLGPQISKSSAFSKCYKSLFGMESLNFQNCINDQETRKKIQEEFKVDAVAFLSVEADASEDETYGSRFLPGQLKDVQVSARFFYKLDLATADIEPLLTSIDQKIGSTPLTDYRKLGSLQIRSAQATDRKDILFVKTVEFLSAATRKLNL